MRRAFRVAVSSSSPQDFNPILEDFQEYANRAILAVWINSSNDSDVRVPFGGVKQSGIGRECGQAGIEAYTSIKSVFVSIDYARL